jgi:hypothetical protein
VITFIDVVAVHCCHRPHCCHCCRCPPSILIAPASVCLAVLPFPTAAATAAAGVVALSPPSLLIPACVPHAIVEVNPPINIASDDSGCTVAIVVAPDINDVSVPWEDGITNVRYCAIAAVTTTAASNDVTAVVVALASTVTITIAFANVTAAIVVTVAAATAAVVVTDVQ